MPRSLCLPGILVLIHFLTAQGAWAGLIPKDSELSGLLSSLEKKPTFAAKELGQGALEPKFPHAKVMKIPKVQRFSIEGPRAPEIPSPRLSDGQD